MGIQFDASNFISAGAGALAAFALEGLRAWRDRNRAEQDAANQALLTLAQMWQQLENLRQQVYVDAVATAHAARNREPLAIEILPLAGVADLGLRLDMGSLSFLLRTHHPEAANVLALAEAGYLSVLMAEGRRSTLHVDVQKHLAAAAVRPGVAFPPALLDTPEVKQLEDVTSHQRRELPIVIGQIEAAQDVLLATVRLHFPVRRFIRFERRTPTPIDTFPAAWWRRWLRPVVDRLRGRRVPPRAPASRRADSPS